MGAVFSPFEQHMNAFVEAGFGAALAVAPEKESALHERMAKFGIRFEPLEAGALFQVFPDSNPSSHARWRVQTTAAACYYVWAFVNYQWKLASALYAALEQGAASVNVDGELEALEWAGQAAKDSEGGFTIRSAPTRYPLLQPYPPPEGANKNPDYWASEVALAAIGWIIQHELVHAIKNHHPAGGALGSSEATKNEAQADREALEWILATGVDDDAMVLKRSLGIVCAIASFVELELRFKRTGSATTHPPAAERLLELANSALIHSHAVDFGTVMLQEISARYGVTGVASSSHGIDLLTEQAISILRAKQHSASESDSRGK